MGGPVYSPNHKKQSFSLNKLLQEIPSFQKQPPDTENTLAFAQSPWYNMRIN